MFDNLNIALDPLLPMGVIIALGALAVIFASLAALTRLRSGFTRALAGLIICLALLNPQSVTESRSPLPDVLLVLQDRSDSMSLGGRDTAMGQAYTQLKESVADDDTLEIINAPIPASSEGTRMTSALIDALGGLPANRLAGVIALTDGQVHDLPESPESLLPDNTPFHGLIIGDPDMRDRRIRTLIAPQYGLVGEQIDFDLIVDDPGHNGERAIITVRVNGVIKTRYPAIIGNQISLPLTIDRRGQNTVELTVDPADDELTLQNNTFVTEISGIRDRLRVLLVVGEPHSGGRAWRNLLKSDPAVDLVQFTILTTPGVKNTNAPGRDLSLIPFPVDQLFRETLDEFDLIIFDRFRRRTPPTRSGQRRQILDPFYISNVARYVEKGGALLIAAGPDFASEDSLYRSPLASVLPARPTGDIVEDGFKAKINEKGNRHPITADFVGHEDQNWGRWFRIIESSVVSGHVLMEGPDAEPLMIIDKVGEGRVGMLMSDQAWLWSKGFENGGPYNQMFRRLSHWLMGEPDLDAEKLTSRLENGILNIERQTLTDEAQSVIISKPDGTQQTIALSKVEDGIYRADIPAKLQGAYRIRSGNVSTIASGASLNPKEFFDLKPTGEILAPLIDSTDGGNFNIGANGNDLPNIRRVRPNSAKSGENWIGLNAHDQYNIDSSRRSPLTPALLFFALFILFLGWAWRREGQ